jgi:hypothetical protein
MVIDNSVLNAVLNLAKHTITSDPNLKHESQKNFGEPISKHKSSVSGNQTDGNRSPMKSRIITPKDSEDVWKKTSEHGSDVIWKRTTEHGLDEIPKRTRPICESRNLSTNEFEEGLSLNDYPFRTGLISKITRIESSPYRDDERTTFSVMDEVDTSAINPIISLRQCVMPTDLHGNQSFRAPSEREIEHAGVTATKISILKGLEGILNTSSLENGNELDITAKPSIMKKWNQWIETGHKNTVGISVLHLMTNDKNQTQNEKPNKGSKPNSSRAVPQISLNFGLKQSSTRLTPNGPKFRNTAPNGPKFRDTTPKTWGRSETIFPQDKNRSLRYLANPKASYEKSTIDPKKRFVHSATYDFSPTQKGNFQSDLVNDYRLPDEFASETLLADSTEKKPKEEKESLGVSTIRESEREDKDSLVSGPTEVYEIDDQIDFELISHETNSVFSYLNKSEIFAD